ncbi:MAG: HNH endonuclease [Pseudomonadales bacterium]
MKRGPTAEPVEAHFWRQVVFPDDPAGCWIWSGAHLPRGYGVFRWGRKNRCLAHRFAYWLQRDQVPPDDAEVCHHCDTPGCVRGDHLFLGTHRVNMADMWEKGRARPGGKVARDVCSVEGCGRAHRAGGLCGMHRERRRAR